MKTKIIQSESTSLIGVICINEKREAFLHYIIPFEQLTKIKFDGIFQDNNLVNMICKDAKEYCKANTYKLVQY